MSDGIQARAVSFRYRGRPALSDVSFDVEPGVTGLLGPNGAGKSTLMNLVATLRRPATGKLTVDGLDVMTDTTKIRSRVGWLPQRFDVLGFATVERNVAYAAWAKGIDGAARDDAVEKALRAVDLWERRTHRARTLSGGMRQRLGIACAVVHDPAVVVLDEPTVGLDPVQRVGIRRLIQDLGHRATVLVSTHMLEDLAALTSKVIVLNEGRLVYSGGIADLADRGVHRQDGSISAVEAGYAALLCSDQDLGDE
ncbi:ATP-binding cassette domain-containing protein [Aestuariimicrobium sp. p3-SID1156]|uniref:ABC transporter ATP-binding protein n=1 Tax=Aestuariimicrobium sp. p3-SID1156 TaxID=2916038 RepID=UPI00223BC80C|nr:ATP-binding cassette domain-containing protein [Aestuariimicrobium sp. p3-SID1156]MCT1458730.1 ATP-binding cassette domain-containing protein [Aestuariimicrobium sp. p3-SID1156]